MLGDRYTYLGCHSGHSATVTSLVQDGDFLFSGTVAVLCCAYCSLCRVVEATDMLEYLLLVFFTDAPQCFHP